MRASLFLGALGLAALPVQAQVVLHDNGGVVTGAGAASDGADLSAVPTALGATLTGHGAAIRDGQRVADDFVVPAGGWRVAIFELDVFQPGATSQLPAYDRVHVRLWNGVPDAPGSDVVFGDLATDRMLSATFLGAWRVTGLGTALDRPIHRIRASAGTLVLAPGTYWLEWQVGSLVAGGPYAVPVTKPGFHAPGNARQFADDWRDVRDAAVVQDLSFRVIGATGTGGAAPDTLFVNGFED